jgi:hypothetical protein
MSMVLAPFLGRTRNTRNIIDSSAV